MAMKPLQLTKRTGRQLELQATSPSTTAIQASLASVLVQHNQVAVSNNMENCARNLTFITASMCNFTIILAEVVKAV